MFPTLDVGVEVSISLLLARSLFQALAERVSWRSVITDMDNGLVARLSDSWDVGLLFDLMLNYASRG